MHPLCQALLVALTLAAAVFDIRTRKIPNWLVLAGLIAGFGVNVYLEKWPGLRSALLGFGLASLVYFPLYLLRGVGAGDVKLMMAVGAIVGPATWFTIFVVTSLIGGAIAVLYLLGSRGLSSALLNIGTIFGSLLRLQAPYRANPELDVRNPAARRLPHAVMIALGTAVVLIVTEYR